MSQHVVVLTALNLEYEAVRERLVDLQVERHERGTRFEIGTVRGTTCRVALGLVGKGNHPAAVLAERAIQQFCPAAVLFVGVAGALWDATPLGDVVMATHVYAYHGGTSEDDGLHARPRSWEVAHGISQLASHVARTDDWTDTPAGERRPAVHFGAIAAGEIVQNSRISHEARWIRHIYNDALAIEMEAAGIAQAGHLNGASVAIVRGISDRANGTKTSHEDGIWQPKAAANAAAFALRLATELTTELATAITTESAVQPAAGREHTAMSEPTISNSGGVRNFASGVVGIQAAQVTGSNVWIGTDPYPVTPTDLAAELEAFRELLRHEHDLGTVDNVTYQAAQAEVDTANAALPTDTPQRKNVFMLALKKLSGLVAEVAELATKIAGLITAAKGLS